MNSSTTLRISLLMTGSELMSGDTVDTNSTFLAKALLQIGLEIEQKITIGDNLTLLINQLKLLSENSDIILMNGGLGPTQDDLTAEAISIANNSPIIMNTEAKAHIEEWCNQRQIQANAANLKQAQLPTNANIFANAPGSAPAFYCYINQCLIIATPGVPSELQHITYQHILPFLQQQFAITAYEPWRKISLIGIGESRLQEQLDANFKHINHIFEIGFRVDFPLLEFKYRPHTFITTHDKNITTAEQEILQWLSPYIISTANENISEIVIKNLNKLNKTVSTAESCTGGLIASMITQISGASSVYEGSIISYSNAIKTQLLHVSDQILIEYGAVSQYTAEAMLKGVLQQLQTDYGIAVTGIAGPNGGTTDKPAGTVWIAWGSLQQPLSIGLCIPFPRLSFQTMVATIALDLLRRFILGETTIPSYLQRWRLTTLP